MNSDIQKGLSTAWAGLKKSCVAWWYRLQGMTIMGVVIVLYVPETLPDVVKFAKQIVWG